MEFVSLTCPKCGASLEVENNLDTFYCKYCGEKIQMAGLSKAAYKARVRMKELDHEQELRNKELELEWAQLKQEKKDKRRKFVTELLKNDVVSGMLGAVLLFTILGILYAVLK